MRPLALAVVAVVLGVAVACSGGGKGTGPSAGNPTGGGSALPTLTVTPDPARSASATAAGAALLVSTTAANGTHYALALPAGAVPDGTTVTLTPLTSVSGLPLGHGFLAGVQLAPDGIALTTTATLTIAPPAPPSIPVGQLLVGFGYQGSGAAAFPMPLGGDPASGPVTLELTHFSGYGGGIGTSTEQDDWLYAQGEALLAQLALVTALDDRPTLDAVYAQYVSWKLLATRGARASGLVEAVEGALRTAVVLMDGDAERRCRTAWDVSILRRLLDLGRWVAHRPTVASTLGDVSNAVRVCGRVELVFDLTYDYASAELTAKLQAKATVPLVPAGIVGVADLDPSAPLEMESGAGELTETVLDYRTSDPCTHTLTPGSSTLSVESAKVSFGTTPPQVEVTVRPALFHESDLIACPGAPVTVTAPYSLWFSAWSVVHLPNVDPSTGGYVITAWVAGSGSELATRTFAGAWELGTETGTMKIRAAPAP